MKLCKECSINPAVTIDGLCVECNNKLYPPKITINSVVQDIKDMYNWNMLMFYIEIQYQQGEMTETLNTSLMNALLTFKPEFEHKF